MPDIDAITEVGSKEIGEASSLGMTELHHLSLGDLTKTDIEVVLHDLLHCMSGQIDDIEIIPIS